MSNAEETLAILRELEETDFANHPKRCVDCGVALEYYDTKLRADGRQSPDRFWQPTIDYRMSVDILRCMKCASIHMRPE